jgi:hypothetical protein
MKPWKLLLVLLGLLFLFTRCSPQRNEQETLPFETKVEGTTTEAVTESIKESEEETRSEESDTGILFYSFTKNFGGRTSNSSNEISASERPPTGLESGVSMAIKMARSSVVAVSNMSFFKIRSFSRIISMI